MYHQEAQKSCLTKNDINETLLVENPNEHDIIPGTTVISSLAHQLLSQLLNPSLHFLGEYHILTFISAIAYI